VDVNSGAIAQQIDYDEFGNVVSDNNPDFQPLTYAGGLYDSQTKLVRFGARDYDAITGRWTCKDLIGFDGGDPNIYVYVWNNPINYSDPLGLSGWITVYASGNGGISGHAWISYVPDGGTAITTYGTWGNDPYRLGNGLHENLEAGYSSDASRMMHIDDNGEIKFKSIIDEYKAKG